MCSGLPYYHWCCRIRISSLLAYELPISWRAGWCISSVGSRRSFYRTTCTWSIHPPHQDIMAALCQAILSLFRHLPMCTQFFPNTKIICFYRISGTYTYLWYVLIWQFPSLCLWADYWVTGCSRGCWDIYWFAFLRNKEGFVLHIWFFSKWLQGVLQLHQNTSLIMRQYYMYVFYCYIGYCQI